MVFVYGYRIPVAVALQVALEALLVSFAILVVAAQIDASSHIESLSIVLLLALTLASLSVFINLRLGLHLHDYPGDLIRLIASREFALVMAIPVAYVAISFGPNSHGFENPLAQSLLIAIPGLVLVRGVFVFSGIRNDLLTYRILVVGTGRDASAVERALHRAAGIAVVAFYPLGRAEDLAVSPERIVPAGTSLVDAARKLRVDEIVVAAREQRGGMLPLRDLVDCRLAGVRVSCLPTFFERFRGEIPIDSLKAGWLIYSEGFRQGWGRNFVKRTFDLVASILLLLATAPIMVLTAVAILIESGRPVFYSQERVGRGGRTFRLLKFRSMTVDAERDGVPQWARADDPRITAVGNFIRRSRIDELPQIFNVLKGDMSFVGPRPERPFFVNELTEKIPFYRARLSVKPGITGWAQTRFSYGASIEDAIKKLQYDLYYVKNHTLLLDLIIVLKTMRVVLSGEGAR
ncbi:MAG TPA: TIGR03013 family XrtA/PEP-CTERM system glycosyltransferase [Burkholderiales bacterium]|jgi:sugar transferase (PEP-CTERM system associated)|nr:TIGR03013 family XrtA/PEP-CTERM system glycosyltransferase [Burkholderiales bacterium]